MADILPFRALRYNLAKVSADDVMTQPYDKITPAMQDKYSLSAPTTWYRSFWASRSPRTTTSKTFTPELLIC